MSGLYHFPLSEGDVAFVLEHSCDSITHLCDLVGSSGQVRAVVNPSENTPEDVSKMLLAYPNVWVHMSGNGTAYNPSVESENMREVKRLLIGASYSESNPGFGKLADQQVRSNTLGALFSFMGTFPASPPISSLICSYPSWVPPLSSRALMLYEQYLIRNVQPVCAVYSSGSSGPGQPRVVTPSNSFWVAITLPFQSISDAVSATSDSEESGDTDYCCERVFDVISSSSSRLGGHRGIGGIRPKEQLRLDPQLFPNTILLLSRYRRSTKAAPTLASPDVSEDESAILLKQALESLVSITETPLGASSSCYQPPLTLSDAEVRDAAINVITAYAQKGIGGPMASALCAIAEGILTPTASSASPPLSITELAPPPGFPAVTCAEKSFISKGPSTSSTRPSVDPQLMFDLQQEEIRKRQSYYAQQTKNRS